MRKNLLFYLTACALLLLIFFSFDRVYRELIRYSELMDRTDTVYSSFQNLSGQIKNAAVLNPDLIRASNASKVKELFFTDSQSIIQQLDRLKAVVRDSVNIEIVQKLEVKVRFELSWIIESNVPDSIIQHKASGHIASLVSIDSLINKGLQRTVFLREYRKHKLDEATYRLKVWIILFIILSIILLIYTTINLFSQKSKTKRKENELEEQQLLFASIVNSSDDAILSKDLNGIITSWNYGAEKVFGYTSNEIIGKHISMIIPSHLQSEETEIIKRISKGEGVDHYETRRIRKDGKSIDVSLTISPLKDSSGNIVGASKIVRDITQRKEAERNIAELNRDLEEKIIQRTEQLRKANEEMEAFTYSVSHDLRAPLRGIIGFTAILEEDYSSKLDEEAKRITSVIKDNTMKMGCLIDDLLAFSRMGRQEIAKAPLDSQAMVEEVIEELSQQANSIAISWDIQPLPVVKGDVNTLRQVWINLISNAIKYSRNAAVPHIEIGAFPQDGQTVFFVKDNGVGFDMRYKDKLFKVFQRLHSPEAFEGTGVGLALMEKIISKHGGKVWAEAEVDKGASFYFSLPNK